MSSIIEKMASAGQLSKEQVERVRSRVANFQKAAAEDPELVAEMKKVAGPLGVMIPETLRVMGATAAMTGGAALARDVYQLAKDSISKSRSYKAMLDANPDLRNKDAKQVQRVFNTLHNFNPDYAADPMVAGAFVMNQMDRVGLDFNQLKTVIESGEKLRRRGQSPLDYMTQPGTLKDMLQFEGTSPFYRHQQEHGERQAGQQRSSALHEQNMAKAMAERQAAEARAARQAHFNRGMGIQGPGGQGTP